VEIFLGSGDPNDCSAVTEVERQVEGEPTLEKAMRALMAGPTADEQARGLGGWFDDATRDMLISAEVAEGVAEVDFKDLRQVIPNASSSCGSALLLAQLDGTAKQFDDVERTLYSIEGNAMTFYEWLQMAVPDA
jgi:spore germination protein GerM